MKTKSNKIFSIKKTLNTLFQDFPDDVIALNQKGTVMYSNLKVTDKSCEGLEGYSIYEAVSGSDKTILEHMVSKVFKEGEAFTFDMNFQNCNTMDSDWFFCRLTPFKVKQKVTCALLFGFDLQDTKISFQKHYSLREELEKAKLEIKSLKKMITICAWTGKVKMEGKWVRIEEYLEKKYNVKISHGISEEAVAIMESRMARDI